MPTIWRKSQKEASVDQRNEDESSSARLLSFRLPLTQPREAFDGWDEIFHNDLGAVHCVRVSFLAAAFASASAVILVNTPTLEALSDNNPRILPPFSLRWMCWMGSEPDDGQSVMLAHIFLPRKAEIP